MNQNERTAATGAGWIKFSIPIRCAITDGDKTVYQTHYVWYSEPVRPIARIDTDYGPVYLIESKPVPVETSFCRIFSAGE